MKIKLIILLLMLSMCNYKKDNRKKFYAPSIIHKKNVNIALDTSFFQLIGKHYQTDLCYEPKCKNKLGNFDYTNCNFTDKESFEKNNILIKKILHIETLFQYNEKGLLVTSGSLSWDSVKNSDFTIQNPHIEIFYLCYRSFENINDSCQLTDRYYIISLNGLVIKDVIALNLFQNKFNTLHAVPNSYGMPISQEDNIIRSKWNNYQAFEFYYYINPLNASCEVAYNNGIKIQYPVSTILKGVKFVKAVYGTINKNGNMEIDKHNIYFQSNEPHIKLDSVQQLYNIEY